MIKGLKEVWLANKTLHVRILMLFLVSILAVDFLTKIINIYHLPFTNRLSGIVKILMQMYMLTILVLSPKKPTVLFYLAIITFTFCIGNFQAFTTPNFDIKRSFLKGNIYYYNRYVFVFLFVAYLEILSPPKKVIFKIVQTFITILCYNSLLMFLGLIFDVEVLKSYPNSIRFGYSGLFSKIIEASQLYAIAVSAAYYYYMNVKSKKNNLKLILLVTSILVLGTKSSLLYLFVLSIYHFCFQHSYKKYIRTALVIVTGVLILFFNSIIAKAVALSPFWLKIYDESGLLTVLTSTRNILFIDTLNHISNNWASINYIFGGIHYNMHKVEFEWVDVYTMFGLVGVITFISFFKHYFFNLKGTPKRIHMSIILVVSFFSGGMFLSVSTMVYFYILSLYLRHSNVLTPYDFKLQKSSNISPSHR